MVRHYHVTISSSMGSGPRGRPPGRARSSPATSKGYCGFPRAATRCARSVRQPDDRHVAVAVLALVRRFVWRSGDDMGFFGPLSAGAVTAILQARTAACSACACVVSSELLLITRGCPSCAAGYAGPLGSHLKEMAGTGSFYWYAAPGVHATLQTWTPAMWTWPKGSTLVAQEAPDADTHRNAATPGKGEVYGYARLGRCAWGSSRCETRRPPRPPSRSTSVQRLSRRCLVPVSLEPVETPARRDSYCLGRPAGNACGLSRSSC